MKDRSVGNKINWYPIAASQDLAPRHVFDAQLLGQEMAAWRADDGFANIWENRCLHRGVRLSIGINDGSELQCAYHGWRYANRSASCSYIPAHPADAPARTVCNKTYPCQEKYGLVWTCLEEGADLLGIAALDEGVTTPLRSMPVNASLTLVAQMLSQTDFGNREGGYWAGLKGLADASGAIVFQGESGNALAFFLQPVDTERTVIRGVATGIDKNETQQLRHLNTCLSRLRSKIEAQAITEPQQDPIAPDYTRISAELATMPDREENAPPGHRVTVLRKEMTASDIALFELGGLNGPLPTGQAGAHIDLHLPNGLTRQYSLTNGPGETETYVIGVKREAESSGGSSCLHDVVREGDVLVASNPRNNFPLRRDALRTVFVAGGIGITPLLSMAKTVENQTPDYELHYFVRDSDHVAFASLIAGLSGKVVVHAGLNPSETGDALGKIYGDYQNASHTYICGPGPMLTAARKIATDCGWPEKAIHFEYFKNTNEIDDSSTFEVALARSGLTLKVGSGETVLEVLQKNGVSLASSCCQGACGTCKVAVIEGEVDHQDVHLTPTEQRDNAFIITCVSRAKSDRLVLDI